MKALQNLRRGLCCLLVGENLITGHEAVRTPCLLAPASIPTVAGGPEAPVRLVHGDIFTGLLTVWASQLTLLQLISLCCVCSTAGQEKTGFGSCLSDQPLGLLWSSHIFMLLTSPQLSPWLPQALRAMKEMALPTAVLPI